MERSTGQGGGDNWSHFPHDADIGIRGTGSSVAAAFAGAARALTGVMTDPEDVRPLQAVAISCEAPDLELLLVEWLDSLVYEISTRGMLFSRFDVSIDGTTLSATVWGEPLDRERHHPAAEVKGATLTALRVRREADGDWIAQCVVDV